MESGLWLGEPFDVVSRYALQHLILSKLFSNEKTLPLRQKKRTHILREKQKPSLWRMQDITRLIYHYEPLMNENIILLFLQFYAWLWSISRGGSERDKRCGWHCSFDITNNCIYDGIIQFIYFPPLVPIKRWHFPSLCSLLMFYVLLSSRACVLLGKRANFSQWNRGGDAGTLSITHLPFFC